MPEYRQDIQSLRGIAVLMVLMYHNQLFFFEGGFLGVDIFFVISGFLITGMIKDDLLKNQFSFRRFFLRRTRRLLPAALTVIGICLVLESFFLTSQVSQNLFETAIASLFFLANVSLWMQSGYFESSASLHPLLHMWSLAIEEQFYLLVPLLLVILPQRRRFGCVLALTIASFALCVWFGRLNPSATFYLLPTRAWELGLGACLALRPARDTATGRTFVGYVGLALLLAVPLAMPGEYLFSATHPGLDALLVCGATCLVLMNRCNLLAQSWAARCLSWFGGISYSLYLVHWPLTAFANNAYMLETPPVIIRIGLSCASVLLALCLCYGIEKPMRFAGLQSGVRRGGWVLSGLVMASLAAHLIQPPRDEAVAARLSPNMGLSADCEFSDEFRPISACLTSPAPEMLVWRDSYAMHLVPGLAQNTERGLAQATKSLCSPMLKFAPFHKGPSDGDGWVDDCLSFNQSVFDYLRQSDDVEVVVLSSVLNQYHFLGLAGSNGQKQPGDMLSVLLMLEDTARQIRAAGKKVVLVAPPPSEGAGRNIRPGFDIGLCLERLKAGLWLAGGHADCMIDEDTYRSRESWSLELVSRLQMRGIVPVLSLDDALCDGSTCETHWGSVLLYRDKGHLSVEGSKALVRDIGLVDAVIAVAK